MSNQTPPVIGQANKVLSNDGQILTWTTLPAATPATVTAANNGTSLDGTTVVLGNAANGTSATLTSVREIPTGGFGLFTSGTGRFGIGRGANQPPQALLHVGPGNTSGTVGTGAIILGSPNTSANIGEYSLNAGLNNRTVGNYNFATGQLNNIYVNNGAVFGAANTLGITGQDPQGGGRESFAAGFSNTVRGTNSGAIGNQCTVLGGTSFATGFQCQAGDTGTFVAGNLATATGAFSVSMGDVTSSPGIRSQSFGYGTLAQGKEQMVVGSYNIGNGTNAVEFLPSDCRFIVGNGTVVLPEGGGSPVITRKNAFTVQTNGAIQLQNNPAGDPLTTPSNPTMSGIMFRDNIRHEWDTTLAVWVRKDGQAEFADNAAAIAGGLPLGAFYRTGDVLKVVHA